MIKKVYVTLHATIISLVLSACVGGRSVLDTPSLTVASRTYSANHEVVNYSNGRSETNTATGANVTWVDDHLTKTITYTFADGTINQVVSVVPGFSSIIYTTESETVYTTYGDGITSSTTRIPRMSLKDLLKIETPQ